MQKIKLAFKKNKYFIPVNTPFLTKGDADSVAKVINEGWISSEGSKVSEFEKRFSKFIGHKFGTAVSSGTAALDIVIKSLKLKRNDQVILPNFTIISNLLPLIKQGIKFQFIDCKKYDWNMDLSILEKKINKNTKAIIATHIFNFPLNMIVLKKICKEKKIILIEDAAEVLGQKLNKKFCGSFGDISVFSFYANKQITTGEGGMITTNNSNYDKLFKSYRNLSFGKKHRFDHEDISWNYRLTNMQASLGLNQLKRIDQIVKRKHEIGKLYYQLLKNNKNFFITPPSKNGVKNIYWVFPILSKNKNLTSVGLIKKLNQYNVGTRPFFWPMHKQKILRKLKVYNSKSFANSTFVSKYGIYLPSGLGINNREIQYVCSVLNNLTNL